MEITSAVPVLSIIAEVRLGNEGPVGDLIAKIFVVLLEFLSGKKSSSTRRIFYFFRVECWTLFYFTFFFLKFLMWLCEALWLANSDARNEAYNGGGACSESTWCVSGSLSADDRSHFGYFIDVLLCSLRWPYQHWIGILLLDFSIIFFHALFSCWFKQLMSYGIRQFCFYPIIPNFLMKW